MVWQRSRESVAAVLAQWLPLELLHPSLVPRQPAVLLELNRRRMHTLCLPKLPWQGCMRGLWHHTHYEVVHLRSELRKLVTMVLPQHVVRHAIQLLQLCVRSEQLRLGHDCELERKVPRAVLPLQELDCLP